MALKLKPKKTKSLVVSKNHALIQGQLHHDNIIEKVAFNDNSDNFQEMPGRIDISRIFFLK